jgi:hypothetical protein
MNGVALYVDDNHDNIFLLDRLFKRSCHEPAISIRPT